MQQTQIKTDYCAEKTVAIKEPIWGTARAFNQFIFIGWPKNLWTEKALFPRNMPQQLSEWLTNVNKNSGTAVRLVNIESKALNPSQTCMLWQQPKRPLRQKMIKLDEIQTTIQNILDDHENIDLWQRETGEHLFVCCHGIKDKCCAKFGFRSLQAIKKNCQAHHSTKEVITRPWSFYETTHLIGDRFAGNAIHFPKGQMIARLREQNAVEVFAHLKNDQVPPDHDRGNVWVKDDLRRLLSCIENKLRFDGFDIDDFSRHSANIRIAHSTGPVTLAFTATRTEVRFKGRIILQFKAVDYVSNCKDLANHQMSSNERWVVTHFDITAE